MKFLDKFILGIPLPFFNIVPYAWLTAIFLWTWPPTLAGILLGIVLLGLLVMLWQERAWRRMIRSEYQHGKANPSVDRPHLPLLIQLRNVALLCAACGLLSWLLNGRLGLLGWQWFALLAGFMLLWNKSRLLGNSTTYLITEQGIAIRLVGRMEYRLYFPYGEIADVKKTDIPKKIPPTWGVLWPGKSAWEGILVSPASPAGFSKQFPGSLLLTPTDKDAFLKELNKHIPVH